MASSVLLEKLTPAASLPPTGRSPRADAGELANPSESGQNTRGPICHAARCLYTAHAARSIVSLARKFKDKWVVRPESIGNMLYGDTLDWSDAAPGAYDGRVESYIDGTTLYALVNDGRRKMHVMVQQTNDNNLAPRCECSISLFDRGGYVCDHIIMVLRHLADNFEELTTEAYTREERVSEVLGAITAQQTLEFLSDVLVKHPDIYMQFVDHFGIKDRLRFEPDYETELDRHYYTHQGRGGRVDESLSFDRYFEAARAAAGGTKTIAIHRAVSEAIQRNMGIVNDSDGYYTDCAIEAVENMAEAVLGLPDRREYIKYMAGMAAKASRNMARHYRSALETVCASDGDLDCLYEAATGLLAERMEGGEEDAGPWQVAELTRLQIYALEEGGGSAREGAMEAILRRLAGSYRLDSDLRVLYIKCLGQSGADNAKQAAVDVASEFPGDAAALGAILEEGIISSSDPECAELATKTFASTGDWKHYDMLKEAGAWSAPDAVRDLLEMGHDYKALEVCMREKMHDKAMDVIESKKSLDLLARHAADLGKVYPERYFEAYASRIREMSARKPDAKARRGFKTIPAKIFKKLSTQQYVSEKYNEQVRDHMLRVKELGDDRYPDLVKYIRSKHSKSTTFLAAVRDL